VIGSNNLASLASLFGAKHSWVTITLNGVEVSYQLHNLIIIGDDQDVQIMVLLNTSADDNPLTTSIEKHVLDVQANLVSLVETLLPMWVATDLIVDLQCGDIAVMTRLGLATHLSIDYVRTVEAHQPIYNMPSGDPKYGSDRRIICERRREIRVLRDEECFAAFCGCCIPDEPWTSLKREPLLNSDIELAGLRDMPWKDINPYYQEYTEKYCNILRVNANEITAIVHTVRMPASDRSATMCGWCVKGTDTGILLMADPWTTMNTILDSQDWGHCIYAHRDFLETTGETRLTSRPEND
jgi:hypothetical protein